MDEKYPYLRHAREMTDEAMLERELQLPADDVAYAQRSAAAVGLEFWKGAIWGAMLSSVLWLAIIFAVVVVL